MIPNRVMSLRESSGNKCMTQFREMSFSLLTTMEQRSLLLYRYHRPNFQQSLSTRRSWNRASESDLTFLQDVMSVKGCPDYNGYMTRSSREQGHPYRKTPRFSTQSQAFRWVHHAHWYAESSGPEQSNRPGPNEPLLDACDRLHFLHYPHYYTPMNPPCTRRATQSDQVWLH